MLWIFLALLALQGVIFLVMDRLHTNLIGHARELSRSNFRLRVLVHTIETTAKAELAAGDVEVDGGFRYILSLIEDSNYSGPNPTHRKLES